MLILFFILYSWVFSLVSKTSEKETPPLLSPAPFDQDSSLRPYNTLAIGQYKYLQAIQIFISFILLSIRQTGTEEDELDEVIPIFIRLKPIREVLLITFSPHTRCHIQTGPSLIYVTIWLS